MIAVLKPNATLDQRDHLIDWLKSQNVDVHVSVGKEHTVLGLVGNTSRIDVELLQSLNIVDSVKIISDPYKKVNRKFHPDNTVIHVGPKEEEGLAGVDFGDGSCPIIAGPSTVESEEQIMAVAEAVRAAGAKALRGGTFKPRTSPYDFQGLGKEGIDLLVKAGKSVGLPVVTDIMNINHLEYYDEVDMIQVSSRNMQNYELLKELGRLHKPVLLKRGCANTLKELLMSAEYIMAGGNEEIVLCERGIRTYEMSEMASRNTLDLAAVPSLHEMTHLPVIVDPTHATGIARMVEPMALAAAACGADGLMIEVHNDPMNAVCDGGQALNPEEFAVTAERVRRVREITEA